MKTPIKIFQYNSEYDAFEAHPDYWKIAGALGLTEWTPVVWITRLLALDNDYGEHIFDNWKEREVIEKKHGLEDASHLLIVVGKRFQDGTDGPCNTDEFRKRFWTDMLKSMYLDLETIFDKARSVNQEWKDAEYFADKYIPDLEDRIQQIRQDYDEQVNQDIEQVLNCVEGKLQVLSNHNLTPLETQSVILAIRTFLRGRKNNAD